MKLALVQLQPQMLAVEANLAAAVEKMHGTAADFYLLPELYPCGYTFAAAAEVDRVAEPAADGPSFAAFSTFARERRAWVSYGFAERGADGRAYNSANLVGPEGLVGTYRKIQLFGREKLFFSPGSAPAPVFELPMRPRGPDDLL